MPDLKSNRRYLAREACRFPSHSAINLGSYYFAMTGDNYHDTEGGSATHD
jgi:hypothetical protein